MSPLTYAAFMEGNPKNGSLKVQIYTAQGAYPVPNAQVTVSKSFVDGIQVFYKGVSDEDGIVEIDNLPAPDKKASLDEYDTLPTYPNYDIEILHPEYAPVRYHKISISFLMHLFKKISPLILAFLSVWETRGRKCGSFSGSLTGLEIIIRPSRKYQRLMAFLIKRQRMP